MAVPKYADGLRRFYKGQIKNDARNVDLIEECYKFLSGDFEKLQRTYEKNFGVTKKTNVAIDVQRIKRLIRFQDILKTRQYKIEGKDVDLGVLVRHFKDEPKSDKDPETELFDMYLGVPSTTQ